MVQSRASHRFFGSALATAALVVGSVAWAASPSVSAPAEDCAEPFPVADLTRGQAVTGLTVQTTETDTDPAAGTTPTPFSGTVIGVLKDGISPGLDMIMVNLTSAQIDRIGIWQGMSGSPVYASDGKLIGAVSYGLATGPSPVAGVTPFEQMNEHVSAAAATRVRVSSATAERIASASGTSVTEASSGFRQLPLTKTVSGVKQARLDDLKKKRKWLKGGVRAGSGSSSLVGPDADTIVAGGNLGAAVSWGDITFGGVGTATSVCNGKVVGFGHPMDFAGRTTELLLPASALYIQADPTVAGFKLANFGEPVGTITDDRLAGITGKFGALPHLTTITEELTYGTKSRTGTSEVSVPAYNPDVAFYQQLANHDRVLDGIAGGTENRTWTITGTDPKGNPFSLALRNRYTADQDLTFEVPWDVADQTWSISSLKGVTVDSVSIQGTVTDDTSTYRLSSVQQLRKHKWRTLSKKYPAYGVAGKSVRLRAVLKDEDGNTTIGANSVVKLPRKARGAFGYVRLSGGSSYYDDFDEFDEEDDVDYPDGSLDKVLEYYRNVATNDQLEGVLNFGGITKALSFNSAPADKVIYGSIRLPLQISRR